MVDLEALQLSSSTTCYLAHVTSLTHSVPGLPLERVASAIDPLHLLDLALCGVLYGAVLTHSQDCKQFFRFYQQIETQFFHFSFLAHFLKHTIIIFLNLQKI
jgi:hypothetical protein